MCKKCLQFGHQKIIVERRRVLREVCKVPAKGEEHEYREINCFYCKKNHITGDKGKGNEYKKELDINKIMMKNLTQRGKRHSSLYK